MNRARAKDFMLAELLSIDMLESFFALFVVREIHKQRRIVMYTKMRLLIVLLGLDMCCMGFMHECVSSRVVYTTSLYAKFHYR